MSNKRLLEDVYGENKAARPWTEQPFDEEDYAYEIETQSVAERVFQMLFGGSNLFLQDDETVTYDKLELWELYLKAPTKQMRESLARRLGPMEKVRVKLGGRGFNGRHDVWQYAEHDIRVPVALMKTQEAATKLGYAIVQMAKPSLLAKVVSELNQLGLPVLEHYVGIEKWIMQQIVLDMTHRHGKLTIHTFQWPWPQR